MSLLSRLYIFSRRVCACCSLENQGGWKTEKVAQRSSRFLNFSPISLFRRQCVIREPSWEESLSLRWICSLFCISLISLGPHHHLLGEIWRNRNQLINFEYDVSLAYFVAIDLAVARLSHFLNNLRQCPQSVIFGTLSSSTVCLFVCFPLFVFCQIFWLLL